MRQNSTRAAGIDTSKSKLDVAVHGDTSAETFENGVAGFPGLVAKLRKSKVKRVGIEATGGYEREVVRYLRAKGFAVVVLQPMQVKAVAKLRLQRAKNDSIDAVLIAACTAMIDEVREAPDERLAALAQDLTYLEQIEADIACWKTRREHADQRQRGLIAGHVKALTAHKRAELRRIGQLLRQHPDLAERLALLNSIQGIAERTAIAIVIRIPELATLSREQAAALAGLAPFDCDSGTHKGERHIAGGRARLRRALFAAAWPASARWNPALKALYRRLIKQGKKHKVALVACARKLLIFAQAVLQRGTPWVRNSVPA